MPGKVKGLLHWCKKVTDGYRGGEVTDMTSSWKNGLAFCALIHRFRPHLIDYGSLIPTNVYDNNKLAYSIAEKELGIMSLLDPNDMAEMATPDRNSVALYVSQLYEFFKDEPIVEREVEYKYTEMDLMNMKSAVLEETLDEKSKLDNGINKEISSSTGIISTGSSEAKSAEDILKNDNLEGTGKSDNEHSVETAVEFTEMGKAKKKDSSSDIDDIFETNAALLQDISKQDDDIKEESNNIDTNIENSLGKKDFDVCDSVSIPENISGAYKSDAVVKAAVCAGITAVAVTASGDNDAEALDDVLGNKNLHKETDKDMQSKLQNGKAIIPEIQITVFKDGEPSQEVETSHAEKSIEESKSLSKEQCVDPEVETKIKSMHAQSIATSSSDSFQSGEYIIVDNEKAKQGLVELETANISGKVLVDVDTNVKRCSSPENSKKRLESYSSESFTSSSSSTSSESDKVHQQGERAIQVSNIPDIFNPNLVVPDKDSETEIFVDEDDEEPPALPAVGPPPLPDQQNEEPYDDDEVVMQGELEVLCPEPEKSGILSSDPATADQTVEGTPSEQRADGEEKFSEIPEPLNVTTENDFPDQTVTEAVAELQPLDEDQSTVEPSPEKHEVDEELIIVSQQESSLEYVPVEQPQSTSVIPENTETGRSANINTDGDGVKVPGQDKAEICHSSSSSDSSSDSSSSSEDEGRNIERKSDTDKKKVTDSKKLPDPDSAEKEEIEKKEPSTSRALEISEESNKQNVPLYNAEKEFAPIIVCMPVMRIKSMSSTESISDDDKIEDPSTGRKLTEKAESKDVSIKDRSVHEIAKDLVSEIISNAVQKFSFESTPDQSYKMDEKIVSDKVSKLERNADTKALDNKGASKQMPFEKDIHAVSLDIDPSVLRKAEEMARKMAEKESVIQQSPRSPTEESFKFKDEIENENSKPQAKRKDNEKSADKEKPVEKDKEDAKARRMEILRQLQRSTRPTKKIVEDADVDNSDSLSDSSSGFKKKMTMWVRKSSTAQEPDETVSTSGSSTPDSASRKSFPCFPSSPVQTPTSPRDDHSNLQKLTQSLPSSPRPGSVAEHVRRLSQSAQQKPEPSVPEPDKGASIDTVVLRRPKLAGNNQEKAMFRRSAGGITSGFVLSRPSRLSQPIKVSVKPLVQRYSHIEENKEVNDLSPAPSPRSSRNSGDFSLVVKPLNERRYTEDEINTKKKAELERKDSLKRNNPPKRELAMNRPRSRSSSRERNVWQHDYESDVITSPATDTITSVTRRDSFEVKVRPVSLQLKQDENVSGNGQDLPRRHSLTSTGSSPTKSGSKVNISIQPLSPRYRSDSDSNAPDPVVEKVISPEQQALSTVAPDKLTQERHSRPRTSLSPRWTSKIDTSKKDPKTEPLTVTTKRPGRSVLNYVQSCLNQKSTPKSIPEKAAPIQRPATFTSADIDKPFVEKRNLRNTLSSDTQPSLTQPKKVDQEQFDKQINVMVDSRTSLKKPSKVDNVTICNSIFGSKAKITLKKEEPDLERDNSTIDIVKTHSASSSSSSSSSASSSFVNEHNDKEHLVHATKDIEIEIVDLPKHKVDGKQMIKEVKGTPSPTLENSIMPVSLPADIDESQKPLSCKRKSRSDSSSSSGSSDSENDKDDSVSLPSLPAKSAGKAETESDTGVVAEEMPKPPSEKKKSLSESSSSSSTSDNENEKEDSDKKPSSPAKLRKEDTGRFKEAAVEEIPKVEAGHSAALNVPQQAPEKDTKVQSSSVISTIPISEGSVDNDVQKQTKSQKKSGSASSSSSSSSDSEGDKDDGDNKPGLAVEDDKTYTEASVKEMPTIASELTVTLNVPMPADENESEKPSSVKSTISVLQRPEDADAIELQKPLHSKEKHESGSSSSSSDSESERDDGGNQQSLPVKLENKDTKADTEVVMEEVPKDVAENTVKVNVPHVVDEKDTDKLSPMISTIHDSHIPIVINARELEEPKQGKKKSQSDSSSSSSSIDSKSDTDGDVNQPSQYVKISEEVTKKATEAAEEDIPKVQNAAIFFEPQPSDRKDPDEPVTVICNMPVSQTPAEMVSVESEKPVRGKKKSRSQSSSSSSSSSDSEGEKNDVEKNEIHDVKTPDSAIIIDGGEIPPLVTAHDTGKDFAEPAAFPHTDDEVEITSLPGKEVSDSGVLKTDIAIPEIQVHACEEAEIKHDMKMDENNEPDYITKKPVDSHDSSSDSSGSEEKKEGENLSSNSTSSVSSAEIEKPELKEGLKTIILELEKEIDLQEHKAPGACEAADTGSVEISPIQEHRVIQPMLNAPLSFKEDNEEISEKDLFEDFDSLVTSLQNQEEMIEYAKDLDVVAEDDEVENVREQEIGEKPNDLDVLNADKSLSSISNSSVSQKSEEAGPSVSAVEQDFKDISPGDMDITVNAPNVTGDQMVVEAEIAILPEKVETVEAEIISSETPEGTAIKKDTGSAVKNKDLHSSSSSSTSSSSSPSSSDKEDELLKNVIEDSQPFKAPLLEEIIDNSPQKAEHIAEKNDIDAEMSVSLNNQEDDKIPVDKEKDVDEKSQDVSDQSPIDRHVPALSIIQLEDPIILSAVADANNITSPLDVKVSILETSIEGIDRSSPVLFPEEEVLKQHGFTDIISESPEEDPILQSAIKDAAVEERKKKLRKDSASSSSSSSDSEDEDKEDKKKPDDDKKSKTKDNETDISKSDSALDQSAESVKMEAQPAHSNKDEEQTGQDDKVEDQSVQSESEDGMKYKFQGKDGNCYLLLDSDPTSPVAKTLIAMEKQKSEKLKNSSQCSIQDEQLENLKNSSLSSMSDDDIKNLKNASLSSMSDDQIQNVIDSITKKQTEYIPVSDISVSLKNPEYLFTQVFDPFEMELIEPRQESFIEAEVIYPENETLAEVLEESGNRDDSDLKLDIGELINEPVKEPESIDVEENTTCDNEESFLENNMKEFPHIVDVQDENVIACQPNLFPEREKTFIEHKVHEHPMGTSTESSSSSSSSSDTSRMSSSNGSDNKLRKKRKKKRKTKHTKKKDIKKEELVKCDEEYSEPKRRKLSNSSDSETENIKPSEEEQTVPNERLVNKPSAKSNGKGKDIQEETKEIGERIENVQNEKDIPLEKADEESYVIIGDMRHDMRKTFANNDTLDDKATSENKVPLKKLDKVKSSTSGDSSSSSESSESDTEVEKNVIQIEKDNIHIDEVKSKVYHSDDNLKSEIKKEDFKDKSGSDKSDSDREEIIEISKHVEPLRLRKVSKHEEIPNYENWPLVKADVRTEGDNKDTEKDTSNQDTDEK